MGDGRLTSKIGGIGEIDERWEISSQNWQMWLVGPQNRWEMGGGDPCQTCVFFCTSRVVQIYIEVEQ